MPHLRPFHGLMFDADVAGPLERVTAPPYDIISDARRLEYLRASPFSVVRVDLAEGSDDPADPANRYARAGRLLAGWEQRGVLRRAGEPSLYAYEMTAPGKRVDGSGDPAGARSASPLTVRGVICAMVLEDWGGSIVPHERVMDGPVQDRLALLRATTTHLSPVYVTVDSPRPDLDDFLDEAARGRAPFEMLDEREVRHRVWPVPAEPSTFPRLADERALIADGHHRYTTALRYRDERRRRDGAGAWDSVLTLVVDARTQHLPVLPFHRVQVAGDPPPLDGDVVPDLDAALSAISDDAVSIATIRRGDDGAVTHRVVELAGRPPTVRALHLELLDERAPEGSLRYLPEASEAEALVARGGAIAAYLLPPTTPDRIRGVVERGERLPQKSTFFWPKPRTGMVMMPLDRAVRAS
ncbi:MAG: DUF1015 family protein [Actinomycetota bacterium]